MERIKVLRHADGLLHALVFHVFGYAVVDQIQSPP
jgi:hypothetical protein